jgi:hypothetical protein
MRATREPETKFDSEPVITIGRKHREAGIGESSSTDLKQRVRKYWTDWKTDQTGKTARQRLLK